MVIKPYLENLSIDKKMIVQDNINYNALVLKMYDIITVEFAIANCMALLDSQVKVDVLTPHIPILPYCNLSLFGMDRQINSLSTNYEFFFDAIMKMRLQENITSIEYRSAFDVKDFFSAVFDISYAKERLNVGAVFQTTFNRQLLTDAIKVYQRHFKLVNQITGARFMDLKKHFIDDERFGNTKHIFKTTF